MSVAAINLARMEATLASSAIGLVKDSLGLKLDTPFKLLTSLICCLTIFGGQRHRCSRLGGLLAGWVGVMARPGWNQPASGLLRPPTSNSLLASSYSLQPQVLGSRPLAHGRPFSPGWGSAGLQRSAQTSQRGGGRSRRSSRPASLGGFRTESTTDIGGIAAH